MKTKYTINSISQVKGHIMTQDKKYYLQSDGDFDYWRKVRKIKGDILTISPPMGRYPYDYVFRCNIKRCVDKLNELLK